MPLLLGNQINCFDSRDSNGLAFVRIRLNWWLCQYAARGGWLAQVVAGSLLDVESVHVYIIAISYFLFGVHCIWAKDYSINNCKSFLEDMIIFYADLLFCHRGAQSVLGID